LAGAYAQREKEKKAEYDFISTATFRADELARVCLQNLDGKVLIR